MGIYATVSAVRAEPEVPDASPPADADLEALIARAEEQIDVWLGPWPVLEQGPSSGRKVAQAAVRAWQWTNLSRATVRLAVAFYVNPAVLTPAEFEKVQGPHFRTEGPRVTGPSRIPDVANVLNASGLRITGARLRA